MQIICHCTQFWFRSEYIHVAECFGWTRKVCQLSWGCLGGLLLCTSRHDSPRVTKGPKVPPSTSSPSWVVMMKMGVYRISLSLPFCQLPCQLSGIWAPHFLIQCGVANLSDTVLCLVQVVSSANAGSGQARTIPENFIQYFTMMPATTSYRAPQLEIPNNDASCRTTW